MSIILHSPLLTAVLVQLLVSFRGVTNRNTVIGFSSIPVVPPRQKTRGITFVSSKGKIQASFQSSFILQQETEYQSGFRLYAKKNKKRDKDNSEHDDDDDNEIDLSDRDWRAFRAKLVMTSSSSASSLRSTDTNSNDRINNTLQDTVMNSMEEDYDGIGSIFQQELSSTSTFQLSTDLSQWAYDSGNVIEQGAVILGGVDQDFGFGLRQQYFHKAVMLVLEHDENTFTRGIILNRPTDILIQDDINPGVFWKVWYGGDVQGLKLQSRATIITSDITSRSTSAAAIAAALLETLASTSASSALAETDDSTSISSDPNEKLAGNASQQDKVSPALLQYLLSPPEIVCLHSLDTTKDKDIRNVSVQVLKDIYWTPFQEAKKLVQQQKAKPTDFWLFAGYAGWGPGQLAGELDRKSWYMCSTDSQTLLKELAKQGAHCDPRDAGLDTWELLMNMIGRGDTVEESAGSFDDLMLKEWVRENLVTVDHQATDTTASSTMNIKKKKVNGNLFNPLTQFISRAMDATLGRKVHDVTVGSIVRASSEDRSPFLLEKQEFHKSLILITYDDENISVGVMLNRPSTRSLAMSLVDRVTGVKRVVSLPIRFGGEYAIKDQANTVMWLHNSSKLKALSIGTPIGVNTTSTGGNDLTGYNRNDEGVIWKCTQEDATTAISKGFASPFDFLLVSGVSIWTKGGRGIARGIQGEVSVGRFEVVPTSKTPLMWDQLRQQQVLTKLNLMNNLFLASEAWALGSFDSKESNNRKEDEQRAPVTDGIGEGFDEEDDSYVFKSDVKVSKLSDDALRSWVATFLLGAPVLGA